MTDDNTLEIASSSPSFRTELASQLAELVPEAIADGKVDVAKLQELLADDSADDSERFGLFWPGKKRALRAAQEPTTATLRPIPGESKDWDTTQNVFIEGDNLEVLKILQRAYHNRISMIYIDPPYNTGKDFIYPDNFKEGLQSYLEFTGQVDGDGRKVSSNSDSDGRYHSNWLNMMYPRLKLARNLLSDDGLIFVSIDDNEFDNLKKLLNEVFGESNFVASLAVEMSKTQGMKVAAAQAGQIVKNHEYILVYARDAEQNSMRQPLFDASELYDSHYDVVWDGGGKATSDLVQLLEADATTLEAFEKYGLRASKADLKKLLSVDPTYHEHFIARLAPTLFRESPIALESVQNLDLPRNEVVRHGKYILRKNSQGTVVQLQPFLDGVRSTDDYAPSFARATIRGALWKGFHSDMMNVGREGGVDFKNGKKPVRLIAQLLKYTNRPQGIVLDFFAGSGTTADAVMRLNSQDGGARRFVLVQLPEPIDVKGETVADITKRRIDFSGDKVKADIGGAADDSKSPLDIGYRTYTLVDTNFSKWRVASDIGEDDLRQHLLGLRESSNDASTEQDLLAEVLLKQGYSLSEHTEHLDIADLSTWKVGAGDLIAYLNEHTKPTLGQLRELAGSGASRLVILEDAFHGDDELKTNLAQLCKTLDVELWTA